MRIACKPLMIIVRPLKSLTPSKLLKHPKFIGLKLKYPSEIFRDYLERVRRWLVRGPQTLTYDPATSLSAIVTFISQANHTPEGPVTRETGSRHFRVTRIIPPNFFFEFAATVSQSGAGQNLWNVLSGPSVSTLHAR